jgi:hypothetical protein
MSANKLQKGSSKPVRCLSAVHEKLHKKRDWQILRLPAPYLTDAPFTPRQPGFERVAKR